MCRAADRQRPVVGRVEDDGAAVPTHAPVAIESFFNLPQKNVLNSRRWATRQDLRRAIVTWTDAANTAGRRRRRSSTL
jgi:hypothetical protein